MMMMMIRLNSVKLVRGWLSGRFSGHSSVFFIVHSKTSRIGTDYALGSSMLPSWRQVVFSKAYLFTKENRGRNGPHRIQYGNEPGNNLSLSVSVTKYHEFICNFRLFISVLVCILAKWRCMHAWIWLVRLNHLIGCVVTMQFIHCVCLTPDLIIVYSHTSV